MPKCPECGAETNLEHHEGYSGDGWNEPRVYEQWAKCPNCKANFNYQELDRLMERTDAT